jgi:hypothetical protein
VIIIFLKFHATTEDENDDIYVSFCKELEHAFYQFPKHHLKNLLGHFTEKFGRRDIFKTAIANESLCEISKDNGVRCLTATYFCEIC